MHFDNTAATLALVAESLVKVTCLQHLKNFWGRFSSPQGCARQPPAFGLLQ